MINQCFNFALYRNTQRNVHRCQTKNKQKQSRLSYIMSGIESGVQVEHFICQQLENQDEIASEINFQISLP